jgi:hypothetical protein
VAKNRGLEWCGPDDDGMRFEGIVRWGVFTIVGKKQRVGGAEGPRWLFRVCGGGGGGFFRCVCGECLVVWVRVVYECSMRECGQMITGNLGFCFRWGMKGEEGSEWAGWSVDGVWG